MPDKVLAEEDDEETCAAKASNPFCGQWVPAVWNIAALGLCTGESVLDPPPLPQTPLYTVWWICTVL